MADNPLDDLIALARTDKAAFAKSFELNAKLAAEQTLAAMLQCEPSPTGPASKRYVLTRAADLNAVLTLKVDMDRAVNRQIEKRLAAVEAALGLPGAR